MFKPAFYLGLLGCLLLTACNRHIYAPALLNLDVSYLPKPASFDSVKHAFYVSAGAGIGAVPDGSDNEITMGSAEISGGHVFKNFNLAYGGYGFIGAYAKGSSDDNTTVASRDNPYPIGERTFSGVGGRFSANLFKKIDNVDFRYIGMEAHFSKEYGDYADYRKLVHNYPGYYSASTQTRLLTLGLTSEVIWHSQTNPANRHAFRLFAGRTLGPIDQFYRTYQGYSDGDAPLLQSVLVSISYFMQIKHWFGVGELIMTPSDTYVAPQPKIKLGYQF